MLAVKTISPVGVPAGEVTVALNVTSFCCATGLADDVRVTVGGAAVGDVLLTLMLN